MHRLRLCAYTFARVLYAVQTRQLLNIRVTTMMLHLQ